MLKVFMDGGGKTATLEAKACGSVTWDGRIYAAYQTVGLNMSVWLRLEPHDPAEKVRHIYVPASWSPSIDAWLKAHAYIPKPVATQLESDQVGSSG